MANPLITVLTGAGISTDSGIPDFRGPDGVWTRNPKAERMSDIDRYLTDPEVRRLSWQARAVNPAWAAEPNEAHRALVDLERSGHLLAVVTQNIDRLHQAAGSSPELVLELHGNMIESVCVGCGERGLTVDSLERVAAGEEDPACVGCGGIIKTATVMFGQALDPDVLEAAALAARDCDVFLAVGTSLQVHPAAGLCDTAVRHGAELVIVNAQPTPYDDIATRIIRDPIGLALPALVAELTA